MSEPQRSAPTSERPADPRSRGAALPSRGGAGAAGRPGAAPTQRLTPVSKTPSWSAGGAFEAPEDRLRPLETGGRLGVDDGPSHAPRRGPHVASKLRALPPLAHDCDVLLLSVTTSVPPSREGNFTDQADSQFSSFVSGRPLLHCLCQSCSARLVGVPRGLIRFLSLNVPMPFVEARVKHIVQHCGAYAQLSHATDTSVPPPHI